MRSSVCLMQLCTLLKVQLSTYRPWPHITAGAPAANATFFCDNNTINCYFLRTSAANYSSATEYCNNVNGTLVEYDAAVVQVRPISACLCSSHIGRALPAC
jgi:hypothetical protein